MTTTTHNAPEAQVVARSGAYVTVLCPYCGDRHDHERTPGGYQRRAPGCGLWRSQNQRASGYWFIIK